MKTGLLFILVYFILIISTPIYAQKKLRKNTVKQIQYSQVVDTISFTVYGMDCPGCASGLEKQVNKIQSVKFSNADWLKQELKIVLHPDSTLNTKDLEKRVKKANFTLKKDSKNKN